MKKNGFTLVELLAVIVVLGIVMVLATTTVLPLMEESRVKAFRTEATAVIETASTVKDLHTLNQVTIPSTSCATSTKICFTVDDLIDLGYHKGNKDVYDGTVTIDIASDVYTLNLKKNNEFAIIGGNVKDYIATTTDNTTNGVYGALDAVSSWPEAGYTCSCN